MTHLLVTQLRFARSELARCLEGVSDGDARRRLMPINCMSWMVGHLADQENRYWVITAQGKVIAPELNELVGFGRPASTPPLGEMWDAWRAVTAAADIYLDTLTPVLLEGHLERDGQPRADNVGTMLLRNLYHYWFHIGEACAVRQMLGHEHVPEFVGSMAGVPYRPE